VCPFCVPWFGPFVFWLLRLLLLPPFVFISPLLLLPSRSGFPVGSVFSWHLQRTWPDSCSGIRYDVSICVDWVIWIGEKLWFLKSSLFVPFVPFSFRASRDLFLFWRDREDVCDRRCGTSFVNDYNPVSVGCCCRRFVRIWWRTDGRTVFWGLVYRLARRRNWLFAVLSVSFHLEV
jgi:hypothetical protein